MRLPGQVIAGDPRDYPREVHDRLREISAAALAEVGVFPTYSWDEVGHAYWCVGCPDDLRARAVAIAARTIGLPLIEDEA